MKFDGWLATTRELQTSAFGTDPATLEGRDLAMYVMWNNLAARDELSEALQEIVWKPWVSEGHGKMNRTEYIGELVDVLHFVANMLVAAKCTDEELTAAYGEKVAVNRERMAAGYSGMKCPDCGRARETMTAVTVMGGDAEMLICPCGANLREVDL